MYLAPSNILCGWCNFSYQNHVDGYAFLDDAEGVEVYCERDPFNILAEDHNAPVTFLNGDQFPIAHGDFDYYADTFLTLKDQDNSNKYLTDANPFAFVENPQDTDDASLDIASRYIDYIEEATEYDPYARNDYVWAAARYADKHPHEFTSAKHAWKRTINSDPFAAPNSDAPIVYTYPEDSLQAVGSLPNALNVSDGQTRNAFWVGEEGVNAGHLVVKVYDEHLTHLYHNRLLNIFTDKRTGLMRLGGLELTKTTHTITAKCVNSKCNAVLTESLDTNADDAEDFVLAIIRHGNNHAASWFTRRSTFYKVHAEGCDLTCESNKAHCVPNATLTVAPEPTDNQLNEWIDSLTTHFARSA